MNDYTNRPQWMNDPLVKDISPEKLSFLERMFHESRGKSKKDMISFLMPMMKKAQQEHLTFTPSEMSAAVTAIKKYSSEEDIAKMDDILAKAHKKMQ